MTKEWEERERYFDKVAKQMTIIIIIMICWAALELGQKHESVLIPSLPTSLSVGFGATQWWQAPGGPLRYNWIYYGISTRQASIEYNFINAPIHTHTCTEWKRENLPKCKRDSNTLQGLARLQWTIIIGLNRNYLPQWATMRHICRYSQRDRHSKERKE